MLDKTVADQSSISNYTLFDLQLRKNAVRRHCCCGPVTPVCDVKRRVHDVILIVFHLITNARLLYNHIFITTRYPMTITFLFTKSKYLPFFTIFSFHFSPSSNEAFSSQFTYVYTPFQQLRMLFSFFLICTLT